MHQTKRTLILHSLTSVISALALAACVADGTTDEEQIEQLGGEPDIADESIGQFAEGFSGGTVADAAATSCGTVSVKGLSQQIIEESNCIAPGAFAPLTLTPNASTGSNVFANIQKPARDKLQAAMTANPNRTMTINSMLRTAAQQYLLYNWYQTGRCGISLAAKPGLSNHETGTAIDIQEYSAWRSTLEANGFRWLGSSDPWHFDYVGAGVVDQRGLDVLAFQKLWNRNNPGDKIAEDGVWGPGTESRMRRSPADGFPTGATCNATPGPSCTASFADICSSPHQADIDWLARQGLVNGCGNGNYCPNDVVTRGQMAVFLTNALKLPAGPERFTDDNGSPYEAAINAIAAAGVSSGCNTAGTEFCPTQPVTRAEMATFLVKAFKLAASQNDLFVDDESSIHEASINALGAAGITSGCDAVQKLYCPSNVVTRGQMATFSHRAMD
ncbi:MAG TPA: S-layer homology domain-containing protein [Polyangium sp.]|nr:S-layer homology domain-containing protein [Polyangium sp.]